MKNRLLACVDRFPEQLATAWRTPIVGRLSGRPKNIILCGMGGSALGAHLVRSTFHKTLSVPLEIVGGYELPGTVTKNSLCLLSSFSGTTEEVLTCYQQASSRHIPTAVITSGGPLLELARRDHLSLYHFDPDQLAPEPRYGTGFMATGVLLILKRLGFVRLTDSEVQKIFKSLSQGSIVLKKKGRVLAGQLRGRVPILVSSEHLEGAAHVLQNQLHESAKNFAVNFSIPELNHHLMEGLGFPKEVIKKLSFVFLKSSLYSNQVQRRYSLTAAVVKKQGARAVALVISGSSNLEQAWRAVHLSGYLSAFLAQGNKIIPLETPWVDWFKKQMKQ